MIHRRPLLALCLLLLAAGLAAACRQRGAVRYTSETLGIHFDHPAGWVVNDGEAGQLTILSDPALNPEAPAGGALVSLFVGDAATAGGGDPIELLYRFINLSGLQAQEGVQFLAAPQTVSRDGLNGAAATLEGRDGELTLTVTITLLTNGDRLAVAIAATPSDQLETYGPALEGIVASLGFVGRRE